MNHGASLNRRHRLWQAVPAAMLLAGFGMLLPPAASAADGTQPQRLLHAEPVVLDQQSSVTARMTRHDTRPERISFRALGRSFHLELVSNARLAMAPEGVILQAGHLEGLPGSWVRLTWQGDRLTGLIHDGIDYFGVEPVDSLVTVLDPDIPQPASGNMIYRLDDLLVDPGALSCRDQLPFDDEAAWPANAAGALHALAAEMAPLAGHTADAVYQVKVAPVLDASFASGFGPDPVPAMLARLNIADGIFTSQLGVQLVAEEPALLDSENDALLDATSVEELLEQLGDYRQARRMKAGITHLFTNRSLDGQTAGMAWTGGMCFVRFGASLSSSAGITEVTAGLLAAHEIAHNFGAPHDGEGDCPNSPPGFLMEPTIIGSSTFSACSMDHLHAALQAGLSRDNCITLIANFDVAMLLPSELQVRRNENFDFTLAARNYGGQPASTLELWVEVPDGLRLVDASTLIGRCSHDERWLNCNLDTLGAGAGWEIGLELSATAVGKHTISAGVSAAADERPANDSAQLNVTVASTGSSSGGGGGGGGALDGLLLFLLGTALVGRRRRDGR